MITERQKYVSGSLKNFGFALMAPAGSIIFQQIVFEKALINYFKEAVLVFLLGWICMIGGYVILKEKNGNELPMDF